MKRKQNVLNSGSFTSPKQHQKRLLNTFISGKQTSHVISMA